MINAFIISTAIAWGGAPNSGQIVHQNPEKEAIRALSKACYKEFGIDKVTKRLEKKYVPKELKEYGVWPVMIVKIVTEKRISYEWTF